MQKKSRLWELLLWKRLPIQAILKQNSSIMTIMTSTNMVEIQMQQLAEKLANTIASTNCETSYVFSISA